MTFSAASVDWSDVEAVRRLYGKTESYWHWYWKLTNKEDEMPIIASNKRKAFTPAPEGVHQAVCVDVVDHGDVTSEFGGKRIVQHKIDVRWQIDEVNPENGKPFLVIQRYTLSLDKKANLRKALVSWRGRDFTKEELEGFDVENLIGVNCQLNIIHNVTDDATYANVASITPLGKKSEKILPLDYVRVQDRPPLGENGNAGVGDGSGEVGPDDDIPF
jgi:hypothetical protein